MTVNASIASMTGCRRLLRAFVWTCVLATAVMVAALPARGQVMGGAAEKVTWGVVPQPETVAPGEEVTVRLEADIQEGWKMYAVDSPPPSRGVTVTFDSVSTALSQEGDLQQSEPSRGYDPNFQKEVSYFEGSGTVRAQFAVSGDAESGRHVIAGTVEFMVCTREMCLPPTRNPFETAVVVEGEGKGGGTAESENRGDGEWGSGEDDETKSRGDEETARGGSVESERRGAGPGSSSGGGGMLGFLLLAIGAGGAALLTPCVFPMIPLTVSFFTRHTDSRSQAVRMAGIYGLAIVLTFTGLGVAMAMILGAAGAQTVAANPWVNLFIGLVFVVFALSLLGLFELKLPSSLVNYFNRQGDERGGLLGVVFMGLTLTLVSFSCTAPFVGGLLAATAGGQWFHPVVGMVAFSATFALPFVGFALFPKALDSLPKSGSWMNAVKVTLGFVELAAALKFLSNADLIWGTGLLSRPLAIAMTVVIFFCAGLYLLGKLRLRHEPAPDGIGSLRLVASMAFFATALYMVPGLLGAPLGALDAYLPPRLTSDVSLVSTLQSRTGGEGAAESEFAWHTDDVDAAFAEAQETGKPVFIDFTGYTCTNCRDMEANVFPKPPVAEQLRQRFVLLRLYTDDMPEGAEFQRLQLRMTGTTALPTYAIVDPADRTVLRTVSGVHPVDEFAAFLERGAQAFRQSQPVAHR
jgi:thiol:disulfide interchange protein DsbD